MHTDAIAVLDFWFGPPDDPGHTRPRPQWFQKDDAFDDQIRQRFGPLVERALVGGIDDWLASPVQPLPALARVIVLDQFTRNALRGTARAFAGDAMALHAARALVASGADRALTGVQRQFSGHLVHGLGQLIQPAQVGQVHAAAKLVQCHGGR